QYIRYGDWISFLQPDQDDQVVDGVVARGDDGRTSGLLVHLDDGRATYEIVQLVGDRLADCGTHLKVDASTGNRVTVKPAEGTISFDGYGVAVLPNAPDVAEDAW